MQVGDHLLGAAAPGQPLHPRRHPPGLAPAGRLGGVGGVVLVYLLGFRLVPVIGAYYLIDLFSGFLVGIMPLLGS